MTPTTYAGMQSMLTNATKARIHGDTPVKVSIRERDFNRLAHPARQLIKQYWFGGTWLRKVEGREVSMVEFECPQSVWAQISEAAERLPLVHVPEPENGCWPEGTP